MMTPLEKAASVIERATVFRSQDCKKLAELAINSFLEAAAEDEELCRAVALAPQNANATTFPEHGQAAILALKETING